MSIKYVVEITSYAQTHYVKKFEKKYKNAWDITQQALKRELQSIHILYKKSIATIIVETDAIKICKMEFKIAGSKNSRKSSGNRCIVVVDEVEKLIKILLVYHKNDLPKGNETANWKNIIKKQYKEYKKFL